MSYVITIARGFGSGGKAVAVQLGKKLGIPVYEEEILKLASERSGISEELFAQADEKLRGSYFINKIKSVPADYVLKPMDKKFVSNNNLFQFQKEIINELARKEPCIIVGKCADCVLDITIPKLRVFIDAPLHKCTQSIAEKMQISSLEAEKLVLQTDKYRADYYKYYSNGKDWREPLNYDLCINAEVLSREKIVKIIQDAARTKLGI